MSHNEASPLLHSHEEGDAQPPKESANQRARAKARAGLDSKPCHWAIVFLVAVDVSIIFGEFIISGYRCEHECRGGYDPDTTAATVQEAFGILSQIISTLFMVELLVSLWAYGAQFFYSAFRIFDGIIILASFILDVCLKGVIPEAGSIIIVLRLWRVFKIIGELSTQAGEEVTELGQTIAQLEKENDELKDEIKKLKRI